ncbi:MAG: S-layer homology domain-containing protein [Clostridiales bacterium]|nr:S-layer homology domain-containing protein [Clostridiales bacterium]
MRGGKSPTTITESGSYEYDSSFNDAITVNSNVTGVTITLENVNITGDDGPAISIGAGAEVTLILEGENELTGSAGYAAIAVEPAYDQSWNYLEDDSAKLTITGDGDLTAIGGDGDTSSGTYGGGAGIGGNGQNDGNGVDFGTIIIDEDFSGTINATGGKASEFISNANAFGGGAGIGSGGFNMGYKPDNSDVCENYWGLVVGNIEINGGGTINAASNGGGAGIGGGSAQGEEAALSEISVTITNGYITAEGGEAVINNGDDILYGAGIGGGGNCDGGYISISGGTVIATAGESSDSTGGAGIGGGDNGSVTSVEITGGNVTAIASGGAAGIGGGTNTTYSSVHYGDMNGDRSKIGTIEISGEDTVVKAIGGTGIDSKGSYFGGAGIGSGYPTGNNKRSVAFDISITDGATVYAKGGYHAQAIGYGYRPTDYTGYGIELEFDDSINLLAVNDDYYQPALVATTTYEDDPITYSSSDTYLICYTDTDKDATAANSSIAAGYLGSPYTSDNIDVKWAYSNYNLTLTLNENETVIDTSVIGDVEGNWAVLAKTETVTYTVTFEEGKHGDLDGTTEFEYDDGDTISTVPEVDPNSGYKFVNWYCETDGKYYTASEVKELTVTSDLTFVAQYEKKSSSGGGGSSYSLEEIDTSDDDDEEDDEDYDSDIKLNTDEHFQYISGYPDGTVRPTANITRAEVATIFYRLLDDNTRNTYFTTYQTFDDVDESQWYLKAIATMTNAGILHGDANANTYRPDDNITRAEFATIVSFFDEIVYTDEDAFSDISGHWANVYINSAYAKGWVAGYNGKYNPDTAITRAEAMTLINNVLGREVDEDGLHEDAKQWPDNLEYAWYYYEVLEATNYHEYTRDSLNEAEDWTDILPNKVWNEGAA